MTDDHDYQTHAMARLVQRKVAQISHILHGLDPIAQSNILADLLALLLAGHFVAEELDKTVRPRTAMLRAALLELHVQAVRELLPLAEQSVMQQTATERAH